MHKPKFFSASLNCLYSTGNQTLGWLSKLKKTKSHIVQMVLHTVNGYFSLGENFAKMLARHFT